MGELRDHILVDRTPSATPSFPVKSLSTPGFVQRIITDNYHWIIIKVRKFQKGVQEVISRDDLTTKWVHMFSRRAR